MRPAEVDAEGRLRAKHHDGLLEGVRCTPQDAVLYVQPLEAERYALVLKGVRGMALNDFWHGNIIMDICVFTKRHVVGGVFTARRDLSSLGLSLDQMDDTERLFALDSSYGARMAAVCEGVFIATLVEAAAWVEAG